MVGSAPALTLTTAPPPVPGDRCGSWPLQVAPQLARVRGSVDQLARLRYAHPSLDLPEPSLLGVMERLSLVVSELGGNALRHGHAPITVVLARLRGGWLVTVSDGAPDLAPVLYPALRSEPVLDRPATRASPEPAAQHRHGLQVVALVSNEVGWYADDSCKHVWASVPDHTPSGLTRLIHA